jgi:hypothetical protein
MGRVKEVAELVRQRVAPAQIARQLGISDSSVASYLHRAIGEGHIRRSDIAFSIPEATEAAVASCLRNGQLDKTKLAELVRAGDVEWFDIQMLPKYGGPSVALGDMYEALREFEMTLHSKIRSILEAKYGPGEGGWWRQGIPERIRTSCVTQKEKDPEPADDPYCYTTFIDLKEILDQQWGGCLRRTCRRAWRRRKS